MQGIEVSLTEMLDCRERRAAIQKQLIEKYGCPLISFSMNIPGPIKTNASILAAFEKGKDALLQSLANHGFEISARREFHDITGDELVLAVYAPAEKLKELTTQIEEAHPIGRLYDMDVIDSNGEKLSRSKFRKCLICGKQAQDCARSRTHTVAEMQAAVEHLLNFKTIQD